jgi:hypothetical protein
VCYSARTKLTRPRRVYKVIRRFKVQDLEGFIRLLERVLEDTILNNSILLRML